MSGVRDANGVYVFREIAQLAASPAGEGFLSYLWQRPGKTETSNKLARIVSFKPWGWVLVSGLYVDDINAAFYGSLKNVAGILGLMCAALSAIVVGLNRSLQRAIGGSPEYAADVAMKIAGKDLSMRVLTACCSR